MKIAALFRMLLLLAALGGTPLAAIAQDLGPFMPHNGAEITTAWTNSYGPDAESWMRLSKVTSQSMDINYASSRGTLAVRRIPATDREGAQLLVLGFSIKMPLVIENSTTIGLSLATFEELRSTGTARILLAYNEALATIPGQLTSAGAQKMPVDVGGSIINVPVMHVMADFAGGNRRASGDFYVLNNRNNPLIIQYSLKFNNEKTPRTERIVRVMPGESERAKMEQALATMRRYDHYGIHFNFDKATIRRDAGAVIADIAVTLENNPLWTLEIAGHTDSIGDGAYNRKLSKQRADAVRAALVKAGISADRLSTVGRGATEPKASNKTLQGRALNRRVELLRTDR